MNLAIEYILRDNRIEQLLTLPCSLFLENINKKSKKLVIMLDKCSNEVLVKHYSIWRIDAKTGLPPFRESILSFSDIFRHPDVIMPGYKLLEFKEQIFIPEEKQVAELPLAAVQERRYKEYLTSFYSPKILNQIRENWLWQCFCNIEHRRMPSWNVYNDPAAQREHVRMKYPIYKIWEHWKNNLLLNSNPAAELVFAKYYNENAYII